MKFHTLKIKNFCSIEEVSFSMENQGLVLITGSNEDAAKADSNGSGKSLLLEAFCWCLWGKTIRGLTGDDVVRKQIGKDCRVSLSFSENDVQYLVVRTRKYTEGKPNDLRLYVLPKYLELTSSSMSATQDIINGILGMDFTTFRVMMPGAGMRAAEMTDKQVKLLLESLLQTESLGNAYINVREKKKETEIDLKVQSGKKELLDNKIKDSEKRLENLKKEKAAYESRRQERIADIETQIATLEKLSDEQDVIISKAVDVTDQINNLQSKINELVRQNKLLCQKERKEEKSYYTEYTDYQSEIAVAESTHESIVSRLKEIEELGPTCIKCGQIVDEIFRADTIKTLEASALEVLSELQQFEAACTGLEKEYQQTISDIQITKNKLRTKEQLIQKDLSKFIKVDADARAARTLKATLQPTINGLRAAQDGILEETNPVGQLMLDAAQEAAEAVQGVAELCKQVELLEHKNAILAYWLVGFSPQGIRSFMLEHVTPLLNEAARKYSDFLTDGEMSVTFNTQTQLRSGKTAEKFNIEVTHLHGGESYEASSSGEKSRANLVVAFALGDLAALRAAKRVSFRFLDEPFENVDESGTDAIVTLLNDQKERFESVFVITHQDHFKQLFPKEISVVKQNGVTSLVGDHG
jgi:DNA repair exonuclease SbcCD ATPase subunit